METNIRYKGEVNIKIVGKDGKVKKSFGNHNVGNSYLFNFLTSCLSGDFYNSQVPAYVMLYNKSGTTYTSSLSSTVYKSSKGITSNADGVYKVKYLFYIPKGYFINTNIVNYLMLFNQEQHATYNQTSPNSSAEVNITDSTKQINPTELAEGDSVLVSWELQFSNYVG